MASGGVNAVSFTRDGGFFSLAATALCCYEHLITFDDEVRCVWRRRISGASALFLLNRYAILAASLVGVVQVVPWSTVPFAHVASSSTPDEGHVQACSFALRFSDVCLIVVNLTYVVFAALRMFAIYGMTKSVFVLVLLAGLLNPLTQMFLMAVETVTVVNTKPVGSDSRFPTGRNNCTHQFMPTLVLNFALLQYSFVALRIHAIIFEGILICLTWKKTATRWSLRKPVVRTPFTTMLLRDGALYFITIAMASALNMFGILLLWLPFGINAYAQDSFEASGPIVDTITSICMSRFILGLLAITLEDEASRFHTSQWKTLRFPTTVETIAGTFAADLSDHVLENANETHLSSETQSNAPSTSREDVNV